MLTYPHFPRGGGIAVFNPSQIDTANTSANAVTIGKANSAFTGGVMDDIRIYSRALSAAEIQQLYNLGR